MTKKLQCLFGFHNVEIFCGPEKGTWLYACDKCGKRFVPKESRTIEPKSYEDLLKLTKRGSG